MTASLVILYASHPIGPSYCLERFGGWCGNMESLDLFLLLRRLMEMVKRTNLPIDRFIVRRLGNVDFREIVTASNTCSIYHPGLLLARRSFPHNKVHGANTGPTRGRQDPGGPHVGPMNFAIWVGLVACSFEIQLSLGAISSFVNCKPIYYNEVQINRCKYFLSGSVWRCSLAMIESSHALS